MVTEEEKPRELFSDGVEKSERDAAAEHAMIWKSMEEQPDERDKQLEIREDKLNKGSEIDLWQPVRVFCQPYLLRTKFGFYGSGKYPTHFLSSSSVYDYPSTSSISSITSLSHRDYHH